MSFPPLYMGRLDPPLWEGGEGARGGGVASHDLTELRMLL